VHFEDADARKCGVDGEVFVREEHIAEILRAEVLEVNVVTTGVQFEQIVTRCNTTDPADGPGIGAVAQDYGLSRDTVLVRTANL
jgi:hypothetical protein